MRAVRNCEKVAYRPLVVVVPDIVALAAVRPPTRFSLPPTYKLFVMFSDAAVVDASVALDVAMIDPMIVWP